MSQQDNAAGCDCPTTLPCGSQFQLGCYSVWLHGEFIGSWAVSYDDWICLWSGLMMQRYFQSWVLAAWCYFPAPNLNYLARAVTFWPGPFKQLYFEVWPTPPCCFFGLTCLNHFVAVGFLLPPLPLDQFCPTCPVDFCQPFLARLTELISRPGLACGSPGPCMHTSSRHRQLMTLVTSASTKERACSDEKQGTKFENPYSEI